MSKYQKYYETAIENVFKGYNYDPNAKRLNLVDESAAKAARESLSQALLEMARDIWTQLDAAEDSLKEVSDEIRFEELNTDPSSLSMTVGPGETEDADVVDFQASQAPEAPAFESIENLLGSDDFNFEDIFENMDHLDNKEADMPFDEDLGDTPTRGGMGYDPRNSGVSSRVVAGEEDPEGEFDDLDPEMGMDNGDDLGMDNGDELGDMDPMGDYEDGEGDMGYDGEGEPEDDLSGFDFDLALGDEDLDLGDEEEAEEGYGHYEGYGDPKSYRMEAEGDDDDDDKEKDDDDDDDDDGDDDDKPAFLKKGKDKDDD